MKKVILFFSVFVVISTIIQTNAQTIEVPTDAATIREAILLANNNDTIKILAGTYTDSVKISDKDLVFVGEMDGSTILSPENNGTSFYIENAKVHFYHLHFNDFALSTPPPNIAISINYSDVKIQNCRFTNMFSPVLTQWSDLEISYSVFHGSRGTGALLHNGGKFLLYNNLIYDVANTTFSINRAHGYFFNNTVVGTTNTEHYGMVINSDSISNIFNNSISGFGIGILLSAADSMQLAALKIQNNNVFDVLAPYWYEYNESLSLPIFSGELMPTPGTGEIYDPAIFIDPQNENFQLEQNSPCIGAGIDLYPFDIDFDLNGNDRIAGLNPDIGAYEMPLISGLNDFEDGIQLSIFPQPTNDIVWVNRSKPMLGSVEIIDMSGRKYGTIEVKDSQQFYIQLPEQAGVYLLRFSLKTGTFTQKVIKQ